MTGLTYDAGALIAAERGDELLRAAHEEALERGIRPTVPACVLAQVWRGGPQPRLSRLLRGCRIEAMTESAARSVGAALGRSDTSDVVDAAVVVSALPRRDVVVTGDPDDLVRIGEALGARPQMLVV